MHYIEIGERKERLNLKRKRQNQISYTASVFIHLFFILFAIACIYPVLLTISVSFTDEKTLIKYGYGLIPKALSLVSYKVILGSKGGIIHAYAVTIFATVVGTLLTLAVTSLYAYPLSRKDFTGKKFFTFFAFFTMLFSGGLIPWYMVCTQVIHINDTIWALILPSIMSAWNMLVLRTFFATSIPFEIIESAKIDGAGELRTFVRIVLPLSKAGIATIGLFSTLAYWNDWYLPMMLTTKDNLCNLQYYLQKIFLNIQLLQSGVLSERATAALGASAVPAEGARMAMCVLAMGPILIVYPFFQKYFIQGLTVGSVKG